MPRPMRLALQLLITMREPTMPDCGGTRPPSGAKPGEFLDDFCDGSTYNITAHVMANPRGTRDSAVISCPD